MFVIPMVMSPNRFSYQVPLQSLGKMQWDTATFTDISKNQRHAHETHRVRVGLFQAEVFTGSDFGGSNINFALDSAVRAIEILWIMNCSW